MSKKATEVLMRVTMREQQTSMAVPRYQRRVAHRQLSFLVSSLPRYLARLGAPFVLGIGVLLLGSTAVAANVEILSPDDGTTATAPPCVFSTCYVYHPFAVEVTGSPMDYVDLLLVPDEGNSGSAYDVNLCSPADQIEGTPGCPDPPTVVTHDNVRVREGSWTVWAEVKRGLEVEASSPIHLTVLPPDQEPPGPVSLQEVVPIRGAAPLLVLEPGTVNSDGVYTDAQEIDIIGENLHNNPFLKFYLAPIPNSEPSYTYESALPLMNWCMFEAERVHPEEGEEEWVGFARVRIPDLPPETAILCDVPGRPTGSIFDHDWRWVVRDNWVRPEREHTSWAIPSPRDVPWSDAPPFSVSHPEYPKVHGFGFVNRGDDASYNEFLTVFGHNAYLCVGAFGACATHVPDPLYHILWWPIYRSVINGTGGTCNGLAATSLLMARGEVLPEDFDPNVHYAIGFLDHPASAEYRDSSWCTPLCGPPEPDNLWATIRMNHGVQFSREFLLEIIETLGSAIFDPNDLSSIKGVPNTTRDRVAADPQGHVLCFFSVGNGHCVTPYRVDHYADRDEIRIYDNNHPYGYEKADQEFEDPTDALRYIEISGGDYSYPDRPTEPNEGKAIMAFPIRIWQNDRHLLGFSALRSVIDGDAISFLYMIAVGAGEMNVTNREGGRWGWEADGSFTEEMMGAISVPPLGPSEVAAREMPLVLAMNQPEPTVRIRADGNGPYLFHTAAGGHLLQLEAWHARLNDEDQIALDVSGDDLLGFSFMPEHDSSEFVPRIGLAVGEEESALFQLLGLSVPGGQSATFGANKEDRSISYRNNTDRPTQHVAVLDFGSGPTDSSGRLVFGPFVTPEGASHTLRLHNWPDASEATFELDLDGDGNSDRTDIVPGRPIGSPLAPNASADLSISMAPSEVRPGQVFTSTVIVRNAGKDAATGVTFHGALPDTFEVASASSPDGDCDTSSGISCDLGTLAPNATKEITYVATASTEGRYVFTGSVFSEEADPDLTNNAVVTTVSVQKEAQSSLLVSAGSNNPDGTVHVFSQAADAPVIQIHVEAAGETVNVERVVLDIGEPSGDGSLVTDARVSLLQDDNGNARRDASEELLAESVVAELTGRVTLELQPALTLAAGESTDLLIVLSVNQSASTTAVVPAPTTRSRTGWQWSIGLAGLLGSILASRVLGRGVGRRLRVAVISSALALMLMGCPVTPSTPDFRFTTAIPSDGVRGTGETSGELTAPIDPIEGATVTVKE